MAQDLPSAELTVLLAEYQRVYTEIMDMQRKSDTLAGLGVTGVGAGLILGLPREVPGMLAIATLFASALVLYITLCYCVIMSLGGYKDYLEGEINGNVKLELLKWERLITKPHLHDAWEMKFLFVVLFALPLILFALSIQKDGLSNTGLTIGYIVSFGTIYIASVSSALRLLVVGETVKNTAANINSELKQ